MDVKICMCVCVHVCGCASVGHQRGDQTHLITAGVLALVLMHGLSWGLGRVWSVHYGQVLELAILSLPLGTRWGGPLTLDGGTLLRGMGGERGHVMFPRGLRTGGLQFTNFIIRENLMREEAKNN